MLLTVASNIAYIDAANYVNDDDINVNVNVNVIINFNDGCLLLNLQLCQYLLRCQC